MARGASREFTETTLHPALGGGGAVVGAGGGGGGGSGVGPGAGAVPGAGVGVGASLASPPPQAAANRAAARAVSRAMRTGCKVLRVFMDAIFWMKLGSSAYLISGGCYCF